MDNNDWSFYQDYLESHDTTKKEDKLTNICPECNIEYVLDENEAIMICENCGLGYEILLTTDPMYNNFVYRSAYKRINKFKSKLIQIQGGSFPPKHIIDIVKKHNVTNIHDLRDVLKKEKITKYNNHTHSILKLAFGIQNYKFDHRTINMFVNDFKKIDSNYRKLIRKRNIIGYDFIIYKIFSHYGVNVDHLVKRKIQSIQVGNDQTWNIINPYD